MPLGTHQIVALLLYNVCYHIAIILVVICAESFVNFGNDSIAIDRYYYLLEKMCNTRSKHHQALAPLLHRSFAYFIASIFPLMYDYVPCFVMHFSILIIYLFLLCFQMAFTGERNKKTSKFISIGLICFENRC